MNKTLKKKEWQKKSTNKKCTIYTKKKDEAPDHAR